MKKLIYIGIGIGIIVALGFIIPPPDGFFGATDDTAIAKLQEKYDVSTEIKAKYQLDNGSLVREAKSDPRDRIEIRIGNKIDPQLMGASGTNFEPILQISRWDEVSFSIKPKDFDSVALKDRTLKFDKEKTIFETPNVNYILYDMPVSAENPEGAFEYQIDIAKDPRPTKTGDYKIEFSLNTQGLDFFYQPELTQKEKDEGANRPENVVGSYAVYASEQKTNWVGGKLYRNNKVGHFFYPYLIDANGWKVRAEDFKITQNKETGIGSIVVIAPQDFLDKAVYPVRHVAGLTIGYTSIGVSWENLTDAFNHYDYRHGNFYNFNAGTAGSIVAYLRNYDISNDRDGETNYSAKVFLNDKDSVSSGSHGQIATKEATNIDKTVGWRTFTLASEAIPTGDTIINILGDHNSVGTYGDIALYYDSVAWDETNSTAYYYDSETYATPESPFVADLYNPGEDEEYLDWTLSTNYVVDDFVYNLVSGVSKVYYCIADHTSAALDEPGVGANWATYWSYDSDLAFPKFSVYATYTAGGGAAEEIINQTLIIIPDL